MYFQRKRLSTIDATFSEHWQSRKMRMIRGRFRDSEAEEQQNTAVRGFVEAD
jgi:hypothetical protein